MSTPARIDARIEATVGEVLDDVPDETVEHAINGAIGELAAADRAAARERLEESITTVCEREEPTTCVDAESGRTVCCHRHDPAIEAGPRSRRE